MRGGADGKVPTTVTRRPPTLLYFIITGNSKELLENEVKPYVEAFLAERGLELSKEKTVIRISRRASTFSDRMYSNTTESY